MASKKKKSTSRFGGTWMGLILGMVLGVAAAVAVALFVTQAPMPFKDKASRSTPSTLLPDVGDAPDPNIALYGKDGPAGTRPDELGGHGINPPAPPPEPDADTKNPLSDAIGQIIAGLDKSADTPPAPAPAAPAVTPPAPPPKSSKPAPGTQTTYYLQTGAFRSKDEAQAMMARVLMLGLPVHVEAGQSNGAPINRVRVGPFKGIDEMNRARAKLGDEKIESAVVRP